MGQILIADDERSMREFLSICLKRTGHTVTAVDSGEAAVAALAAHEFDVVVTDLKMQGALDGIGLLDAIKAGTITGKPLDCEVIVVTAFATADTAIAAMKRGAYDYLTKPFHVDEITTVIARALEKRSLIQENLALKDRVAGRVRLAQLLGKSKAMQSVFELIGKIHSTKTNVLITGESGTGKELVARALHTEGNRASKPFVAINCGAIPEELMESELFGHKRGAFTGAIGDKRGLFQDADGGTLFLDEVGELSLTLQVKLLRALQERKVKPIGSNEEVEIDVRLVAATNRDLETEVARGAFRSDLYYRLNVVEIRLPPLRQRREDVTLLADHFLRKFSTHGRTAHLSVEALRRLETYDFPGNVRELENIIERAVALSSSALIGSTDLPEVRRSPAAEIVAGPTELPPDGVDLERLLADFERMWVTRALEQSGGVRKKAASLLGISFRSLRYRLVKLGIDREDAGSPTESPTDPE